MNDKYLPKIICQQIEDFEFWGETLKFRVDMYIEYAYTVKKSYGYISVTKTH